MGMEGFCRYLGENHNCMNANSNDTIRLLSRGNIYGFIHFEYHAQGSVRDISCLTVTHPPDEEV